MDEKVKRWQSLAKLVRKLILISTSEAGSGHPSSSLSAADLTTVLFDKYLHFNIKEIHHPQNDRFIISKGHVSPLLYALWALAGAIDQKELLTLRKFDSVLEGHPTPRFKYAEVATGSLGQGLSIGAGMAYAIKTQNSKLKTQNLARVYVLLGDGEMAEGSVWEAANFASYYKLNNLIAVVDVNRLGQSGETMFGYKVLEYQKRLSSFGWQTVEINGHNFTEVDQAFHLSQKAKRPFAIIAKTIKGKGVSFLENKDGWHGKALKKGEELEKALKEIEEVDESLKFKLSAEVAHENFRVHNAKKVFPSDSNQKPASVHSENFVGFPRLSYKIGEEVATREAYGTALVKLGTLDQSIYALDGDVKNSTFSEKFKEVYPDRFVECFIAEQNMAGVALGLSKRGKIPFTSTFAAFFTRAFDQIRMAAISSANIKFVGSHAGVSIGEDGPSQMGLEDIAMFGAVPNSVILHPSDAVSTEKLVYEMLKHQGISYLRTLRPKTPVIYKTGESFVIGGSKILRQSKKDLLTVVACGITVHEALKAYEVLKAEGVLIRVVDCYSLKPIDKKTLEQSSNTTIKQLIVTVEDHYKHGGLGDFVLDALSGSGVKVIKLAVRQLPRSGTPQELLDFAGISAKHIVETVNRQLSK